VSADKVEILPGSGIDVSQFTPAPFKQNKVFTFLLVSRLILDKGIMEYVEAIRILKAQGVHAKFQLLGAKDPKHKRGIQLDLIEGWIKEGIVEYLGKTDDVRPYVNAADCVVLPSYREGSPRSLMEAACLAKPIVTTDVAGCRQVVEDGVNGLLCELQNANDLAAKMKLMIDMPVSERQIMGLNGRHKMETEFSDVIVLNKYVKAMNEILGTDQESCVEEQVFPMDLQSQPASR
jgi:glycosyltransferase involved in cell wall biosynthesis